MKGELHMNRTSRSATSAMPDQAALQAASALERAQVEVGAVYRLLGRIETAHFVETVSAKVIAQAYTEARALIGKLGSVAVQLSSGKTETVSSVEEFCEAVMPVSARRCRQIVGAMELLGESLFDQAERIGFRARDYQALKALPADDQALVKQAIDGGDREQVLDLLSDLAARNVALRKKAEEADKSLTAKDKVIQAKSAKLDKLEEELAKRDAAPLEEAEQRQLDGLRDDTLTAESGMQKLLARIDQVFSAPASQATELAARHSLDYLVQRIVDGCLERGITVDLAERVSPQWAVQLESVRGQGKG